LKTEDFDATRQRAWYAVAVLLFAYLLSIMDRQILTLLVGPIQKTLGVNDTLMGLLSGFTFAAFYALMGLPIARLIDRGDRRLIIAVGIALWSLATAASGLATAYWHLLLARIGVAVGEAVLLPGAVSLIADLFGPERRGRAMNLFGASGAVGSGAGLFVGGLILGILTLSPPVLPWLGVLHPWQGTFLVVGLPGIVVALLMLAVPEPRNVLRGTAAAGNRHVATSSVPGSEVRRYIAENWKTVTSLMFGAGFFYAIVYGWITWTPTYFAREFGWNYSTIGKLVGLFLAIIGPTGTLAAGWLGSVWKRRWGAPHAYLGVAAIASVGFTVSTVGMVMMPTANLAIIFVALASCFPFFLFGVGPSAIQEISPAPMRGQFAALYTGILNLLGAGCGPVAIAALTDYVLHDQMAIKYSIGIVCLVFGVIAFALFRRGFGSYRQTLANAAEWRPAPESATQVKRVKPVGRELGKYGIEEYLEYKSVQLPAQT
jgi:MFS family permease